MEDTPSSEIICNTIIDNIKKNIDTFLQNEVVGAVSTDKITMSLKSLIFKFLSEHDLASASKHIDLYSKYNSDTGTISTHFNNLFTALIFKFVEVGWLPGIDCIDKLPTYEEVGTSWTDPTGGVWTLENGDLMYLASKPMEFITFNFSTKID